MLLIHEVLTIAAHTPAHLGAVLQHAHTVLGHVGQDVTVPDPSQPSNVPGQKKVTDALWVVRFLSLGVVVGGLFGTGASMAFAHRRGEAVTHIGRLGAVFAGAFIIGGGSTLISWAAN